MVTKSDKIIFSLIALGALLVFVFWNDVKSVTAAGTDASLRKTHGKGGKEKKGLVADAPDVQTIKQWDLPASLKEVSGIAWIDEQRFACIQDEAGTIFIFNASSGKIEKEIPFSGPGDYEGIALKGDMAYVVRADGKLFEVNLKADKSSGKEYNTSLTVEHDVEGLCYDQNDDRLLLAIKNREPGKAGYKGIYAFDLRSKRFIEAPVFRINLDDPVISKEYKKKKSIMPSEIAIHPVTGEMYIPDGQHANLLVIDKAGKPKTLISLGKAFAQPEGIAFNAKGEMFISNEGTKKPGNILKVALK